MLEFISAGGLGEAAVAEPAGAAGEPLLAQGVRMRDALVGELLALPGLEVVVADGGLVALPHAPLGPAQGAAQDFAPSRPRVLATPATGDLVDWLRVAAADVDLVWAIAPETDDTLLHLCEAVPPACWIGCSAAAIRITSSKTRTREHLAEHGLPVPPAWSPGQPRPCSSANAGAPVVETQRWVLKPDDGAGSEHTRVFADFDAARAGLVSECAHAGVGDMRCDPSTDAALRARWTLEAWVEGEALSLSLLCAAGRTEVLSVNRQRLTVAGDGQLGYAGVDTDVEPPSPALQQLAERIAAAVPGLAGFVGIDLVRQPDGRLCIIEINPRLTCAYAGLVGATLEPTDPRNPAPSSPSLYRPARHSQARRVRNLAAAIIAAHDATLATHAIDTADATPEPS